MELKILDLFKKGRAKHLPKGQVVIYEGDPTNHLYFLKQGYVKVYSILDSGVERIIFIYGPEDVFPLTSYLSGSGVARYFYECMTDVELIVMTDEELRAKVKHNFEAGEKLIEYSNDIQEQFMKRIDILSVNDARRKVIALLSFLLEKTNDSRQPLRVIDIPLTQQDIANMSALTRETASAQILRLKREGIISNSKKIIVDQLKFSKLKQKLGIT